MRSLAVLVVVAGALVGLAGCAAPQSFIDSKCADTYAAERRVAEAEGWVAAASTPLELAKAQAVLEQRQAAASAARQNALRRSGGLFGLADGISCPRR